MDATLVYDDDCGFCTWWAELFDEHSELRTVGFSALSADLRDRLPEDYESCSHLVTEDAVYSCGASIEEAVARLEFVPETRSAVDFLRSFDDYERFRERAYRWAADNRDLLGFVVSSSGDGRR